MSRPDGDSGRVSAFLAVTLTAVLVIVGLSFDAAGRFRTIQRANNLAAEAARAGGQAINLGEAMQGGAKEVDPVGARQAALNYLDLAGVEGSAEWISTGEGCAEQAQCLRVTVELTYQTAMLHLFGFPATIEVVGGSTAQLLTTEPE